MKTKHDLYHIGSKDPNHKAWGIYVKRAKANAFKLETILLNYDTAIEQAVALVNTQVVPISARVGIIGATSGDQLPESCSLDPTPKSYEISTLQDIFNLPTAEAMSRCLKELGEAMSAARALGELHIEFTRQEAKKDGITISKEAIKYQWPLTSTWIDDGGNKATQMEFVGPTNKPIISLKLEKS